MELSDIPPQSFAETRERAIEALRRAEPSSDVTPTQRRITQECDRVHGLLLEKNAKYGDSAANPLRIASTAGKLEAIAVRIDDKLSRIRAQGGLERVLADCEDEDTVLDLIGYLILARVVAGGDK